VGDGCCFLGVGWVEGAILQLCLWVVVGEVVVAGRIVVVLVG